MVGKQGINCPGDDLGYAVSAQLPSPRPAASAYNTKWLSVVQARGRACTSFSPEVATQTRAPQRPGFWASCSQQNPRDCPTNYCPKGGIPLSLGGCTLRTFSQSDQALRSVVSTVTYTSFLSPEPSSPWGAPISPLLSPQKSSRSLTGDKVNHYLPDFSTPKSPPSPPSLPLLPPRQVQEAFFGFLNLGHRTHRLGEVLLLPRALLSPARALSSIAELVPTQVGRDSVPFLRCLGGRVFARGPYARRVLESGCLGLRPALLLIAHAALHGSRHLSGKCG